ncbi:MAG: hypothetical protein QXL94_08220 [Candidatus Parvarchaeum sp.]
MASAVEKIELACKNLDTFEKNEVILKACLTAISLVLDDISANEMRGVTNDFQFVFKKNAEEGEEEEELDWR